MAAPAQTTTPATRKPSSPPAAASERVLTDTQRIAWLRLIRSENVGPVTFRELINHTGSAQAALQAIPEISRRGGKRRIKIASEAAVLRELEMARRIGAEAVVAGEPGYPPWLAHIDAAPPVLYVLGRHDIAAAPIVAIVGSRDGSAAGRKLTRLIARELGAAGYVIASGLARGVDAQAHTAALETGTLAVVAGGIDVIYPPEHEDLHRSIAEHGLIVSECPPGQPPRSQDFPRRNRIISGVSRGVVVIEAARRSGTLITARVAAEQGREVLAVPGHPLDPRAAGTNQLLKNGATLVTSPSDVIEALLQLDGSRRNSPPGATPSQPGSRGRLAAPDHPPPNSAQNGDLFDDGDPEPTRSAQEKLVAALQTTPIEIDELCRATNLDIREVRIILIELELAGRIERHQNQLVSLLPPRGLPDEP